MALEKKIKSYYDFHEMIDLVEKKNNIDMRDYLGRYKRSAEELAIWRAKLETELGKTYAELVTEWGHSNENWAKYDMQWALGRPASSDTIPYCDYWHFFIDCYEISNGCIINVGFADLLEYAQSKDEEDTSTEVPWRTEITKMIVEEVGEDCHDYLISW